MNTKQQARLASQILQEMWQPSQFRATTSEGEILYGRIRHASRVSDSTVIDLIDSASGNVRRLRCEDLVNLVRQ